MERILMRKHPDSVSALIVASKSTTGLHGDQENHGSRKLLEQRIAQLESDAKEQDFKAQQILANVQARFNSVQAKYETHIADLETQVLSHKYEPRLFRNPKKLERFLQNVPTTLRDNTMLTNHETDYTICSQLSLQLSLNQTAETKRSSNQ
ncbi:hypothetical protein DOY81_011629 [Sarcophaga bullata]|nr:hypothetical protein DOY81_011629 [Sarcophaga bullata]